MMAYLMMLRGKMIFGNIFTARNTDSMTLPDQDTWYKVADFDAAGPANGVTPDTGNSLLSVEQGGDYLLWCAAHFTGVALGVFEFRLQKNDTDEFPNTLMPETIPPTGSGRVSTAAVQTVGTGDTVGLWVRCTSGANKTITVSDCSLSVLKVG